MRSCLDVLLAPIPHFLHSVHSLLLCEWLAMARCLLGCCMHCQMCFLYRNLLVPDGKAEIGSVHSHALQKRRLSKSGTGGNLLLSWL